MNRAKDVWDVNKQESGWKALGLYASQDSLYGRIYPDDDLLMLKQFWFFLNTESISADDLVLLADHLKDATSLVHNIEYVAQEIGLYANPAKTELICLKQDTSTVM